MLLLVPTPDRGISAHGAVDRGITQLYTLYHTVVSTLGPILWDLHIFVAVAGLGGLSQKAGSRSDS